MRRAEFRNEINERDYRSNCTTDGGRRGRRYKILLSIVCESSLARERVLRSRHAARNSRRAQLQERIRRIIGSGVARCVQRILMGKVKYGLAAEGCYKPASRLRLDTPAGASLPCFRCCHVQRRYASRRRLAGSEGLLPQRQRQSHQDRLGARRQQQGGIGCGALVR